MIVGDISAVAGEEAMVFQPVQGLSLITLLQRSPSFRCPPRMLRISIRSDITPQAWPPTLTLEDGVMANRTNACPRPFSGRPARSKVKILKTTPCTDTGAFKINALGAEQNAQPARNKMLCPPDRFDMSGKSPALFHHRTNRPRLPAGLRRVTG